MNFFKKICLFFLLSSCANIVAPNGGMKDTDPPKLLNVEIREDSQDSRKKIITFNFNEYIQLNNWEEYFYISPPTKKRAQKKIKGAALLLTIDDTLNEKTSYYIALNSCVKDNNEGNILNDLGYQLKNNSSDTLTLSGKLQDAYTLDPLKNFWIMLFSEDLNDSLIFKESPDYIAKTNENGIFHFPNLKNIDYKITAITGNDFVYTNGEKIAFSNIPINAEKDSFIALFAFNPIITIDSTVTNSVELDQDLITNNTIDSIVKEKEVASGMIQIVTATNKSSIFQLLQNEKVIHETYFSQKPYVINNIVPGKYQLKYIEDRNKDSIWSAGDWGKRITPEKVINYPSEILIRSNWNLELEWIIQE